MATRTSSLRNEPPESQGTLQQALHTLRGIRQRYERERTADPDASSRTVQVALTGSDMFWIAATIEALEKPIGADATEAAAPTAMVRLES